MSIQGDERLVIFTCIQCGFDFEFRWTPGLRKSVCEDCKPIRDARLQLVRQREYLARRKQAYRQSRQPQPPLPQRYLGDYNMAAELTTLRLAVEMIGPLLRTGRIRLALAVCDWAAAPSRP